MSNYRPVNNQLNNQPNIFRPSRHDCGCHKHDCECHKHDCGCHKHDCECHKHDCKCKCHRPKDCKPEKVIVRCNNLTGVSGVPIIAIGDLVTPRTIGSISVADLCCFKRPCVQLEISALITLGVAIAIGTTITFRVFKRCDNGTEIEVQSFDLVQGVALTAGSTIPVAFVVCDCDGCPADCCTYRVTVEATADVAVATAISIGRGAISLIATEGC